MLLHFERSKAATLRQGLQRAERAQDPSWNKGRFFVSCPGSFLRRTNWPDAALREEDTENWNACLLKALEGKDTSLLPQSSPRPTIRLVPPPPICPRHYSCSVSLVSLRPTHCWPTYHSPAGSLSWTPFVLGHDDSITERTRRGETPCLLGMSFAGRRRRAHRWPSLPCPESHPVRRGIVRRAVSRGPSRRLRRGQRLADEEERAKTQRMNTVHTALSEPLLIN